MQDEMKCQIEASKRIYFNSYESTFSIELISMERIITAKIERAGTIMVTSIYNYHMLRSLFHLEPQHNNLPHTSSRDVS